MKMPRTKHDQTIARFVRLFYFPIIQALLSPNRIKVRQSKRALALWISFEKITFCLQYKFVNDPRKAPKTFARHFDRWLRRAVTDTGVALGLESIFNFKGARQ